MMPLAVPKTLTTDNRHTVELDMEFGPGTPDSNTEALENALAAHLVGFYMGAHPVLARGGPLETLLERAGSRLLAQAMWQAHQQIRMAVGERFEAEVVSRGMAYWQRRLEIARAAEDINKYHQELGSFSYWLDMEVLDLQWRATQLVQLLRIGVVPEDGWLVVQWLGKHSDDLHSNLTIECLECMLTKEDVDRVSANVSREAARRVITRALRDGSGTVALRARELVAILEARNQTGYMDLIQN